MKLQRIVTNTFWLLSERVFRIFCSLVVGAWVARFLGAEQFGLLALAQAVFMLLSPLSGISLEAVAVRNIRRHPADEALILGSTFAIRLCGGLILVLVAGVSAYFLRGADIHFTALVLLFALSGLLLSPDVIDYQFQAHELMKPAATARSGSLVLGTLLRVGAILLALPTTAFAAICAVESSLVSVLLITFYRRAGNRLQAWRATSEEVRRLLRQGAPFFISSVFYLITMEADKIIVAQFLGAKSAGLYAAAVRLSEVWYFIPLAFITSFYPRLVESHASGGSSYRDNLAVLYGVTTVIGAGASLLLVITAPLVVPLLYGNTYKESVAVLMVHAPSGFFLALSFASGRHLLAENMARFLTLRSIVAGAVNIVLTCILTRYYGIVGAAIATTISYAVLVLTLILFKETRSHVALCFLSPFRLFGILKAAKNDRI